MKKGVAYEPRLTAAGRKWLIGNNSFSRKETMNTKRHLVPLIVLALAAALLGACPGAATPAPPTATGEPPTATAVPPTPTPIPPTATPVPPTPTPIPPTETPVPPTDTPVPPTPTPEPPTATPTQPAPQAVPKQNINLRGGPGTEYAVAGSAKAGQPLEIVGKNEAGTWLEVLAAGKQAWLSAGLTTVQGDLTSVHVPADIPTPAPQPTAAPKAAGGALSGVLLYSVANMDADRWELWEYNFATGKSRFLKEWMTEAAFSRDYKQVAYFSWGPGTDDQPGICVANADLSNQRLVFVGGPSYPSFSPDGNRIAVQGDEEFYVMNSDGSGIHPVAAGEYPAWSPTGNWIAHRACVGGGCGIYLTDPDSGAEQRLTTGGSDGQPAWSPDGKRLAYISKDDGNFEIYRIDVTGANKVRLTNNPTSDGLPIWSPDGGWIAFRSDRGGSWAIYAMRADGSDVRKVVDAHVLSVWFFEKIAWRP
jgi:hypothetical protein